MKNVIQQIKDCNVSYHHPGKSDRSAMPIGNGELCSSVWVNEQGKICFYISRSDALTELDRTVKLGMVQLSFSPNPFTDGIFEQTLDLADGCITFWGKGASIWLCVDTTCNQIVLQGAFDTETTVTASYMNWRTAPKQLPKEFGSWSDAVETPDIVYGTTEEIIFYHKNGKNVISGAAKAQAVDEIIDLLPDYLTNRIFGGCLILHGGTINGLSMEKKCTKQFSLQILTESIQGTEEQFLANLSKMEKSENLTDVKLRCSNYWRNYWEKSYIFVSNDEPASINTKAGAFQYPMESSEFSCACPSPVTRAYLLTRYMLKCCGNGRFPILYNGMLFNLMPGKNQHFDPDKDLPETFSSLPEEYSIEINPDERSWCLEHLWQNLRHPYYTFLPQGEPESLKVLFRYYRAFWDLNRFRAKKYYNAKGQHNTEMTLSFGLQTAGIYGENRDGKPIGYAQNRYGGAVDISPGLELLSLMLDYYDYTSDTDFFKNDIQTYAYELFLYVETRFTERENGKIVLMPLNSVETYWDTKNPLPVVAGLHSVCERLLHCLALDEELRTYFQEYQHQIPDLFCKSEDGVLLLQPAEMVVTERLNVEIPELYACFPFHLYDQFSKNGDLMVRTFQKRLQQYDMNRYFLPGENLHYQSYSGWQYIGVVAADLGMTDLAANILTHNVQLKNPGNRFPAMWGPIYDAVPDTDHGANLVHQLQEMVMQVKGKRIYLLPAFPKKWDVSFRLHPDSTTTITAEYKNGSLAFLDVFPESEKARVTLCI